MLHCLNLQVEVVERPLQQDIHPAKAQAQKAKEIHQQPTHMLHFLKSLVLLPGRCGLGSRLPHSSPAALYAAFLLRTTDSAALPPAKIFI